MVATYHNDNARTGVNASETTLKPTNVNVVSFGKRAAIPVEGEVFAQPLYISNVLLSDGKYHNFVIIATEHDQVYAIDADTQSIAWHKNFLDSVGMVTPVPSVDTDCDAIADEIGITGTPVADPAGGAIYLVARTKETHNGQVGYYQRLHALSVATGQERGDPVTITTPTDPTGQFGSAFFDPLRNNQRSALMLANGSVYVAWASQCDVGPYQGWLMAFNQHSLALTGAWTPDPSGMLGGIWMGSGGPTADGTGDIFLSVGNGWSDAMTGGSNYGDSVVRLRSGSRALSVVDYFIPFDYQRLFDDDLDLGAGGVVLLPSSTWNGSP